MIMTLKQIQMANQLTDDELVEFYAQIISEVIEDYNKEDSDAIEYIFMQDAFISIMLDIRASISHGQVETDTPAFGKICDMIGTLSSIVHTISIKLYHHTILDYDVRESFNDYLSKYKIYIVKGGEDE